jgi:hypothetical protein
MSLNLDGTAGITFPSGSGTQAAQSKVLQVVNATYSTQVSATSTTWVDTGLSASITPIFSTSKILIIVDQNGCQKSNDIEMYLQLLRGSSSILYFATGFGSTNSAAKNNFGTASCTYLDSPATTSSTTYKTQLGSFGATSTVQTASAISTITLMEIAA